MNSWYKHFSNNHMRFINHKQGLHDHFNSNVPKIQTGGMGVKYATEEFTLSSQWLNFQPGE